MKAAKRSILICVLTLILSVSLLAGVTFAWFTDSITNSGNTIQSGELAIDATAYDRVDAAETDGLTVTIGEGNVASGTYYFEAEGASLRNGDPVITEENWQPGDMNAKLFTVSNEGSIDAVVSLDFFVSGDLAQYLWYDFIAVNPADGTILGEFLQRNDLTTLQTLAADREFTLSPAADLEDGEVSQVTFLFVYGLPTSATNEAMNKAVNVNVVVSAKQNVEGAEGPVVVNPGTDLSETTIDSGDTILLSEGDYEVTQPVAIENKDNVVIDGNGATITRSAASGASIMSASSKRIATAADTQTDLANNIINVSGATNVTIRNLTIVGALHHGINIWECENVVLENVTITDSIATAITINGSNVTLNSVTTSGSGWGGVNVDLGNSGSSEITVDESCAFGEFLPIYADSKDIAAHITVNVPENYNKAIVDLTGIGEDGVERVVWSSTIVETADELNSALFDGGNIIIANDMTVNSFAGYYRQISTDVTVYLNNKTVTSTQTQNTTINGYSTLNLVYGSLVFNNMEAVHAASLLPITGSTVTLDNVKLTSNGTALFPRGDAARVEVVNSEITAPVYAVGTNAGKVDNYNVEIYIYGSTLKTYYTDPTSGSITVFVNVPCSLTIENSYIYGVQNAVMVRCGTATIKNSTLSTPNGVSLDDINLEATWSSGNEVPFGTLLVGNKPNMDGSNDGYQNAATVTVTGTIITSNNDKVPAIYIWGNATEEIGAYLELDQDTYGKMTGGIAGDTSSEHGSVKIKLPDGITLIDTAAELESAVVKGGHYVLAYGGGYTVTNDLVLNNVTTTLDIPQGVNIVLTDNGIFDLEEGSELIINSDGTIENDVDETDGSITKLGYIFRLEDNSKLTLLSGNYYAGLTIVQAAGTSEAKIYSGNYDVYRYYSNGSQYVLNYIDADKETAEIIVYGGSFVNFDPSHSTSENPAANFVAEGYEVIKTTGENETPIYTVVPEAQQ